MCHKSQALPEVCSDEALLEFSFNPHCIRLRMSLNRFLCCLPSLMMSLLKKRTLVPGILSSPHHTWHRVKTMRDIRKQPENCPIDAFKSRFLFSPFPVAPHSSQSIPHTVVSKACTTCSPAAPGCPSVSLFPTVTLLWPH